jgi:N-acetylneuraminate synthase
MSGTALQIGSRMIGPGHRAMIVAEIAQAHDGSLGLAHAFIDAAARAGVDAIKFQTHIAAAESTLDEPFRVKFSRQDETRYAYWQRMEFTAEQWAGLAEHAREKKLIFLSSAFSVAAVELLHRIGMPAWKIASGEVASREILGAMLETRAPFLVSTGMSPWQEIAETVALIRKAGRGVALFQCTTRYPTQLEQIGLNVMDEMRRRFACPVGLSDHSGVIYPALLALARGADMLEIHLTLDRGMFGPDVVASLTVDEFKTVTAARDAFAAMDAHPVDKDRAAEELATMRKLFQRSLALKSPGRAGAVLTRDMLTAKKPASGIPADAIDTVLGRRLVRDVASDRLLAWEDMEPR